jgi:succinate dehydrogenase / fumarate reductase cytochrome b subunit
MKEYAYYPGCAAEASTREANKATQEVLSLLGVKFSSVEDFTCCGAGCLTEEFPKLNLALNARNLAIAEKAGQDILTLCNTCFLNLRKSQVELELPSLREEINAELKVEGLQYEGKAKVLHFLHLLADIGPDKLRSLVKRPLVGLKVAPFYGCHLIRPPQILGPALIQEPSILEELIQATGATPLAYKERLDCCGFHILLVDERTSLHMASHCLDGAKGCGADLMVTPCTLCHISLDMYQGKVGRLVGRVYDIPVLHLAQLMGLAFGIDPRKLHLKNHFVSARRLFSKIG